MKLQEEALKSDNRRRCDDYCATQEVHFKHGIRISKKKKEKRERVNGLITVTTNKQMNKINRQTNKKSR